MIFADRPMPHTPTDHHHLHQHRNDKRLSNNSKQTTYYHGFAVFYLKNEMNKKLNLNSYTDLLNFEPIY